MSTTVEPDGESRATLHKEDGSTEDVTDKLWTSGPITDFWQQDPETPQDVRSSGWQGPDEAHPIETGTPAYRVVYKTLRLIPFPAINIHLLNLRLRILNGDVERGGYYSSTALPARNSARFVVPEYGRVAPTGDDTYTYIYCPDMTLEFQAWQETKQAVSYAEIIVHLESDDRDHEAMLTEGRRAVASLKALLDLKFGPRLLAMPLTEEVGKTFDDWHWNRKLDSKIVTLESQAQLRQLDGELALEELVELMKNHEAREDSERRRIALASQWYWRADADVDVVTRFVEWWLVVETLEMPKETDIWPVRARLAALLGNSEGDWRQLVGRLYGRRSKIVHGEDQNVTKVQLECVEVLARLLLEARLLGAASDESKNALRQFDSRSL